METTSRNWVEEAEESLRSLRDIQGASILAEDKTVREIHILASPGRSAKHIVRDVETCLRTRFSMGIDHRVVSVAFSKLPAPSASPAANPKAEAAAASTSGAPLGPSGPVASPDRHASADRAASVAAPVAAPAKAASAAHGSESPGRSAPRAEARSTAEARIRFVSVNVYVSGPRVQAQVELRWKGLSRMGSASGWASRDSAHRLIAAATLSAVQEFLEENWAMSLQSIEFVKSGREEVVVLGLSLITHRHEKLLAGCCPVEQDAHQAVVLATLGAVNRVVGGLPTREPTEYVLRPASRQEESGAKKH
ncbi:MAG: hypothetical protein ABIS67_03955 [Candidatus Eisenbacteria bacterium]